MDEICGAALRETVQGRAPATADGGNILAEQTEAGKRLLGKAKLNCHFGEGELFPYSKPPGETLSDPHALPDGGGQGASAAGNAPGGGQRPPAAETALPRVSNSSGPYPPVDRNVADAAATRPLGYNTRSRTPDGRTRGDCVIT